MLEAIAVGLITHVGVKAIDRFWQSTQAGNRPVVDGSGHFGTTSLDAGRTLVARDFTVQRGTAHELIVGNLYLPASVREILAGDEIVLVLVIEETQQGTYLFAADVAGYAIELPHGIYSFYIFLVDADADDLFDALIHAVGFPTGIDLSDSEGFELKSHDDIWTLVDNSPITVLPGGPYSLDFILIDTLEVPEFPMFFAELFEDDEEADDQEAFPLFDLTGTWKLEDRYEFGTAISEAYLAQQGNKVSGLIIVNSTTDQGEKYIVQEAVSGTVQGTSVSLAGTSMRVLVGKGSYFLDSWSGTIQNKSLVQGMSMDEQGIAGQFTMRRTSKT
jgi:hypothetical protein